MTILETERLRLRHLTADDAAFILQLLNEPAWLQFIGDRGVRTPEQARDYLVNGPIAMYARLGFGLFGVERKSDGEPLGICGLIQRDTLPDVDLGFAFLEKFWGLGYAREAAAATMTYAQGALALQRLIAITTPDNHRSTQLLERLGFAFERVIRLTASAAESKLFGWPATTRSAASIRTVSPPAA